MLTMPVTLTFWYRVTQSSARTNSLCPWERKTLFPRVCLSSSLHTWWRPLRDAEPDSSCLSAGKCRQDCTGNGRGLRTTCVSWNVTPGLLYNLNQLTNWCSKGFTSHSTHFWDVVPSQSLGLLLKKLNLIHQKQTTQEQNGKNHTKANLK